MTNLSEPYKIIREKYIEMKREIVYPLLKYISDSTPSKFCILCNTKLEETNKSVITEQFTTNNTEIPKNLNKEMKMIEKLICNCCIIKIHSHPPCFVLKLNIPVNLRPIQQSIEEIRGISSHWNVKETGDDTITYEELKIILEENPDGNYSDFNSIPHFVRNYKDKLRRDDLKALIKCRIKSKIELIEDQLKILESTHSKALLTGRFDDSDAIKELYFNMYENKIVLEEKLCKFN